VHQFGFETLITVLIPGLLLTAGGALALEEWAPGDLDILVQPLKGQGFEQGVALLVVAATLGSALATMLWVFEVRILDRFTAWRLDICDEQFDREWSRYVDSLTKEHNSHISRMVQAFYFELRCGVAGMGVAILVAATTDVADWVPVVLALLSMVMALDAARLHLHLARFRRRHHNVPSVHAGTREPCDRSGCRASTAVSPEGILLPAGNVASEAERPPN
jgi:hypothetical protein